MEKSLKINVEKEGAPWSFVKSCSIWIFLLPLVGLPFILPSVISHKSPSCLKTWSVHWCFLCQTEFSICLSSFALLRTSLLVTLTWWPELPFAWRFLMCTIYISCFITFLCISSVRFIMYSFLHCGDVSVCVWVCVRSECGGYIPTYWTECYHHSTAQSLQRWSVLSQQLSSLCLHS